MDTNFSWEYEFILLTTIIYFYIISQQYDYFKPNFLLRVVLETEIVVVEGHFSTVPSFNTTIPLSIIKRFWNLPQNTLIPEIHTTIPVIRLVGSLALENLGRTWNTYIGNLCWQKSWEKWKNICGYLG